MKILRWVLMLLCLGQFTLHAVTSNINVQFLIGDVDNGTFQGNYHVTFGIYPTVNVGVEKALWTETHQLQITQGKISQVLGTKTPFEYHLFKSDQLYIGLSFQEIPDRVFVPFISVPAAVVSKYSVYAKEIEFTSHWMKVNTTNERVGIGITQNLTVPFQVVGSANITTLNATGAIHSPDGFNIHKLDYLKLVNLDDYSLSPFDAQDTPTVDVVFVTTQRNVGFGIYVTADIQEQLHVSGNLRVDSGKYMGQASLQFTGDAGDRITDTNGSQLIWDSNKSALRAGFSSNDIWHRANIGQFSTAFGHDNKVTGQYAFSAGKDNQVLNELAFVGGGISNKINHRRSGILSGESNEVKLTSDADNGGYMAIVGGKDNEIQGDYGFVGAGESNQIQSNSAHASILGGRTNIIGANSNFSAILGGESNKVYGDYSFALGRYAQVGQSASAKDGVFIFADTQVSSAQPFQNYYSDQFLIHATNGVVLGLNNFDIKANLTITDFATPKVFPPAGKTVKSHSIRTAGDIIAADKDGVLGFLVGDGTFITNIQSLWLSDDENGSIYTPDKRVGIGINNSVSPAHSLLYIKQNTYPPNVRIESTGGGLLDIGVDTTAHGGVIETNNKLEFKRSSTSIAEMTTNNEFYFKTNVGINVADPDDALDVDGTAQITGQLSNTSGIESAGKIKASTFEGDGSGLTDVPVYYLTPQDGAPNKQVVLTDVGRLGLGTVCNNAVCSATSTDLDSLLTIGDSTSTQLKLQKTDDSRYSTLSSSSQLDISFFNYTNDDDKVFSINSKKSSGSLTSLFQMSGKGHVGILKDPVTNHVLDVNGNINATSLSGNGSAVTNVQLDAVQTNSVTFNATVDFSQIIRLKPYADGSPPTCSTTDVGSIYTIFKAGGEAVVCACVANQTRKVISSGSTEADCE